MDGKNILLSFLLKLFFGEQAPVLFVAATTDTFQKLNMIIYSSRLAVSIVTEYLTKTLTHQRYFSERSWVGTITSRCSGNEPALLPPKEPQKIEPRSWSVLSLQILRVRGIQKSFSLFFFLEKRDINERLAGQPDRPVDDTHTF